MNCPHCDGDLDHILVTRHGAGNVPNVPAAPFICGWCASLMLLSWSGNTPLLVTLPEEQIAVLKTNPILSEAIESAQAAIRKIPGRRKVLR